MNPCLDTLPLELVQKIASSLPCPSNLALCRVNSRLREGCYVTLVFHNIIKNGNGTGRVPPWKWPAEVYQNYSTNAWARLALADYRCLAFENELEILNVGFKNTDLQVYKWLPLLIATHHPVIKALHLPSLSNYLANPDKHRRRRKPNEGFSFCFSAALIHQFTTLVETELSSPLDRNDYIDPMRCLAYPCAIAGPFFLEILRCRKTMAFSDGPIIDNGTWQPPPTLKTLPFSSIMPLETSIPFSVETQFPLCHLPVTTTKEFIEDGVWVGYYSYCAMSSPAPTGSLLIDRPMLDISFQVRTSKNPFTKNLLKVRGTGRDHIGPFYLSGTLAPSTGKMAMIKGYIGQHSFPWEVTMTPFGILGTWGKPMSGFDGGWIWLWKRAWGDRSPLRSVVPLVTT
ncbi:hypothetical protein DL96DRAFT_1810638 [Flagelloscypha sp. PMI_526]|nr:hypothetical protein DL96DRAFT_1810638 [Flagelloscypha sp. PMI_526]